MRLHVILLALLLAATHAAAARRSLLAPAALPTPIPKGPAAYKEGQVLVSFVPGANRAAAVQAVAGVGTAAAAAATQQTRRVSRNADGGEVIVAPLPPGMSVADGMRRFKGQPGVLRVEPNYKVRRP